MACITVTHTNGRVPTKEAVENRKWQMNKDLPFVIFTEVEGVEVNE